MLVIPLNPQWDDRAVLQVVEPGNKVCQPILHSDSHKLRVCWFAHIVHDFHVGRQNECFPHTPQYA